MGTTRRNLRRLRRARSLQRRYFFHWQSIVLVLLGAILTLLAISPSGCSTRNQVESRQQPVVVDRTVRVRLMQGVDVAMVNAAQPPVYFTSTNRSPRLLDLPRNVDVPITLAADGWRVGRTSLGSGVLTLRPTGEGSVKVGERAYRGGYRLVPTEPGRFDLINDVDIEGYLKSVVSKELLANWHEEAYKAQAIAARTYALFEKNRLRNDQHDLNADVRSQMYGGLGAETPKSRASVDATAGIVLAFGPDGEERIFKSYYSACCGGVGQSVMDAFRDPPIAPLVEQNVGKLCSASRLYNWGPVVIGKDELTRRLRLWGAGNKNPIGGIALVRLVEISGRNRFGRSIQFTITDARGTKYAIIGEQFRVAVNTDAAEGTTLFSSYIEHIITESNQIRFVGGHGHGHGVGLCQYCTEARARAGIRHEDIVMYAYPGAKLIRAY